MHLVTPTWPSGHRCALTLAFTVDASGIVGQAIPPLSYAPTGTARLLRLLADAGVHATFGWSPAAAEAWPDLLGTCIGDGHEIALLGPAGGPPPLLASPARPFDVPTDLTGALSRLRSLGAADVSGVIWRASAIDDPAWLSIAKAGISWVSRPPGVDLPTINGMAGTDQRIVEIPVWDHSAGDGASGSIVGTDAVLTRWRDDLDVLRDEGALLGVRLDTAVAGQPSFSRALLHLLDDATDLGDVWVARLGDISQWWLQRDREDPW